jgi:hypothetical protein
MKQPKALLGDQEQSQLQRAHEIDLSDKPFSRALFLRAATLQDEALRDLRNMGLTHPIKKHCSLAEIAQSAAITIACEVTTEASRFAQKSHVLMPFEPISRTADMTVAFSLFILAGTQGPLRAEGIELHFSEASAATALQFYMGHAENERLARAERGIAAFQSIVRANKQNVIEWQHSCVRLTELYVLQWTTNDEELKQRDFLPLFASLLSSLLRSVE